MINKILNQIYFLILIISFFLLKCTEYGEKYVSSLDQYFIGTHINDLKIECTDINGNTEIIMHKQGEIIVINKFGLGWVPCILEVPGLNKLVKKYKSNPNVRFIAFSTREPEKLRKFLDKYHFEYEQRILTKKTKSIFGSTIPRQLVCNMNGEIIYDRLGGYETIYREIDKVIKAALKGSNLYFIEW